MDFLDLERERFSARGYLDKKVSTEDIYKILEAGRISPSAKNLQPTRVLAVSSKEGLEVISKSARLYNAPLAFVVCAKKDSAWVRPFDNFNSYEVDATIVTTEMMSEATSLGLGSVWICYFDPEILRKELNIPEDLTPINILAVGYKNVSEPPKDRFTNNRISMEEFVKLM